jgi:hypothetical protein
MPGMNLGDAMAVCSVRDALIQILQSVILEYFSFKVRCETRSRRCILSRHDGILSPSIFPGRTG